MHDANDCTIASLLYATPPVLNFARIVGELDAKLGDYPHDRRSVSWDLDDVAIFDIDGARLALGWADGLPGAYGACLTVAVSVGLPGAGPDRIAERRQAVCQMIAERIARRHPSDALIWHHGAGMVTSDKMDEMVEACILLSQGTEAQEEAEAAAPEEAAAERYMQLHVAPVPRADPAPDAMGAPDALRGDIRVDVEAIDRAVAEALAARKAAVPAFDPGPRSAPEPEEPETDEAPLFRPRPREAQERARTRLASEVDTAAMERLMERMETEMAATPDTRVRLAQRPARPVARTDRPAPPGWAANGTPANDAPDMPPPMHDAAARIRAALYDAPDAEAEGEKPSIPMRIAVGTMSCVLLVAVAPVGAALLTYNALHGADFVVTARAVALTGAAVAFAQTSAGQALLAVLI